MVQPIPKGTDLDALDRAADGIRPSWVEAQPAAAAQVEIQSVPGESGVLATPASVPPPAFDVFAPMTPTAAPLPPSAAPAAPAPILATSSADLSGPWTPWTPSPDSTQPLGPVPGLTSLSAHPVLQPLRDLIVHRPKLALLGAGVVGSLLLAMMWPSSEPAHVPAPPAAPALAMANVPKPPEPPAPVAAEPVAAPEPAAPVAPIAQTKEPPARAAKQKRAALRSAAAKPAASARLAAPKPAKPAKPAKSVAPNPYR